ncbi:MAG: TerB family tellurite resistance protein [Symploca sp. SIO2E6]|nr:TerB family tellurite resistance protein [Symploca sp. SIO2E6]
MEIFQKVISILAFLSIGFSLTEVYLTVNPIWKRKHERVVAESISVSANLVSLIPGFVFGLNFLLQGEYVGLIDTVLFAGLAVFYIVVGMSLWVEGERKKGLWTLIKQTLNFERKEAGDLAKSFFKPSGAQKIISILGQLAMIDEVIDPREKQFIQSFVDNWNINYSVDDNLRIDKTTNAAVNLIQLRNDVTDYLATSPPQKQVSELKDITQVLINIDQEVSEQEKLIMGELDGLFSAYIAQEPNAARYHVIVVPQNERQVQVIMTSLPELTRYEVAEGIAYNSDPFYSKEYADVISDGYRSLNLFSIVTFSLPQ